MGDEKKGVFMGFHLGILLFVALLLFYI